MDDRPNQPEVFSRARGYRREGLVPVRMVRTGKVLLMTAKQARVAEATRTGQRTEGS